MLKTVLRKSRYVLRVLKIIGPGMFLRQLKGRIYSRTAFIGLEKDLNAESVPVQCRIEYTLHPGTEEDMEEVLQKTKSESKESARELLRRKSFYESGFRNFYVARTGDTNEICHIKWMITADDNDVIRNSSGNTLPLLKAGEVIVENTFTFEKYRRTRIGAAVRRDLAEMARKKGFKRMIGYVERDNPASLRSFIIDGYHQFEEIDELRFLFLIKRKYMKVEPLPAQNV